MPITDSIKAVQAAINEARRAGRTLTPTFVSSPDAPSSASSASGARRAAAGRGGSSTRFDTLIKEASRREGIDPALVKAVVQAESAFDPGAVSTAGAKGLMQLTDATARSLGVADSFDPIQNVAGGVKYLKQLLGRYGGDTTRALAAYNAGPGAVDSFGGIPPYAETQGYVQKVLHLKAQDQAAPR
jgi:soluble lytic murein transglycosylase-like protein